MPVLTLPESFGVPATVRTQPRYHGETVILQLDTAGGFAEVELTFKEAIDLSLMLQEVLESRRGK